MSLANWYWLLMFLWLIFGLVGYWPEDRTTWRRFAPLGSHVILFLLFLVIGFRIFGGPIK